MSYTPSTRQIIPVLHVPADTLPAICRAHGMTLEQARARLADPAAGAVQQAAIDLARAAEVRAMAAVIDRAISDSGSYSPLVLAEALVSAGYRK